MPVGVGGTAASCVVDPANVVRALCSVDLPEAGPSAVELTDGDETVRFDDAAVTAHHEIAAWGLTPDSEWAWTVPGGPTGTFTTGTLPVGAAVTSEEALAGGASTVVDVMFPTSCGRTGAYVVAMDAAGRVRWYQDFRDDADVAGSLVEAFHWSEDDTVLGLIAQAAVSERDLAGREVLRIAPDQPAHHDLFRRDGLTWLLQADEYTEADGKLWVEDRAVAYDATGVEVDDWNEHGNLVPTDVRHGSGPFWADEFPGADDAWHTNGIYVTPEGGLVLSLLRPGSIIEVDGGEISWVLAGDGVGVDTLPGTLPFEGTGDPAFEGQHDPTLLPDGDVLVLDNADQRGLELSLDLGAHTSSYVDDWPFVDVTCGVQGSVTELPGGHHLLTCSQGTLEEYDADDELVSERTLGCTNGALSAATRGIPLDLWDAHAGTVTASRVPVP